MTTFIDLAQSHTKAGTTIHMLPYMNTRVRTLNEWALARFGEDTDQWANAVFIFIYAESLTVAIETDNPRLAAVWDNRNGDLDHNFELFEMYLTAKDLQLWYEAYEATRLPELDLDLPENLFSGSRLDARLLERCYRLWEMSGFQQLPNPLEVLMMPEGYIEAMLEFHHAVRFYEDYDKRPQKWR